MSILALNAGAASIRFAPFAPAAGDRLTLASHGAVEGIGAAPHCHARDPAGAVLAERQFAAGATHEDLLGVRLDREANALGTGRISAPDSKVSVWVIPTDGAAMIAHHTRGTLCGCHRPAAGRAARGAAARPGGAAA